MTDTCIPGFVTTQIIDGQPKLLPICNVADQWSRREGTLRQIEEPIPITPETVFKTYPTLARMSHGDNWQLILELDRELALIKPTTMFWVDQQGYRSTTFEIDGEQKLYLEFLFVARHNERLRSLTLVLREVPDTSPSIRFDETAITDVMGQIDQWLETNTQNPAPFAINADGVAQARTGVEQRFPVAASTATGQLRLLIAGLKAFQATQQISFRQRSLLIAEALVTYFYGSLPTLPDVPWFPHGLVNAGDPFVSQGAIADHPENYGFFDVPVTFTNGVGQLPDAQLADVYKVYDGQLNDHRIDAAVIVGRSYAIESWTDANGIEVQALAEAEEFIEPQGRVLYVDGRESRFVFYLAFVFGAL